jgi:hypothetical protein
MSRNKSQIGVRVKIEYFDHNEGFAPLLPRSGVVTRQVRSKGVDDWFLVKLDEPFDYQIRNSDAFSFLLLRCENILIRSRWQGHQIGDTEPTSVFILLIVDETNLKNEPIDVEQFYHVAWGMCHTESVQGVKLNQ